MKSVDMEECTLYGCGRLAMSPTSGGLEPPVMDREVVLLHSLPAVNFMARQALCPSLSTISGELKSTGRTGPSLTTITGEVKSTRRAAFHKPPRCELSLVWDHATICSTEG
jgi:hypothetical protein